MLYNRSLLGICFVFVNPNLLTYLSHPHTTLSIQITSTFQKFTSHSFPFMKYLCKYLFWPQKEIQRGFSLLWKKAKGKNNWVQCLFYSSELLGGSEHQCRAAASPTFFPRNFIQHLSISKHHSSELHPWVPALYLYVFCASVSKMCPKGNYLFTLYHFGWLKVS